jgi:hypothetical protein
VELYIHSPNTSSWRDAEFKKKKHRKSTLSNKTVAYKAEIHTNSEEEGDSKSENN